VEFWLLLLRVESNFIVSPGLCVFWSAAQRIWYFHEDGGPGSSVCIATDYGLDG